MKWNRMQIIFNGKTYTLEDYNNFKRNFHAIANHSSKLAILMKRTPDLLFAICMCLEEGITYIPIDPTYPRKRIQYIIDNSEPDDLLTDMDLDITLVPNKRQVTSNKDDVAYILYTSGSTGVPKGVKIKREGIFNFMDGICEILDYTEHKRIACFATETFDMFFPESIMALYKGLTVVLANKDERHNPRLMAELIVNQKIDMMLMTPSAIQLLLNYDKNLDFLKSMKEIIAAGEPLPLSLLRVLQEKTMGKIYNMYGPTETTIASTISDLTNKDRIDIGNPIKNTEIYIVDEELHILQDGEVGEICIAGKGLAKGYCGNESLTKERFICLPNDPNVLIYKTGDLGRRLPDGKLEYIGRMDNQVKIRGYRIELEEIEAVIHEFPGISQVVARTVDLNETDKALEAVYVGTQVIDKDLLRKFLTEKLPNYMIPVKYTQIKAFSYTLSGKIDRKNINTKNAIVDTDGSREHSKELAGLTELQRKAFDSIVSNIDQSVFDNLSIDDSLEKAGVDSISFVKIIISLEEAFGITFDVEMLHFEALPTIRSIMEYTEKIFLAQQTIS